MTLEEPQETELAELVARLDRLIPREGAHLTIPRESGARTTIGNQLGYLRFGLEFLMAALRPLPETEHEPARIAPDLDGLLTSDSRAPFDLCEVDEAITSRPPARTRFGFVGQLALGVALVMAAILLFVGVAIVLRWLFT
jgi:hypothetical protein